METKRLKIYVHRDKSSNYHDAEEEWGIDTDSDLFQDNLRGLCYELDLHYDLNMETGETKLVGADGRKLSDEPIT